MLKMIEQHSKKAFAEESKQLIDSFKEISRQVLGCDLHIKQLKSASVFPEIVSSSTQLHISWNMQFWNYYEIFLFELFRLIKNKSYKKNYVATVSRIFFDFLSLKFVSMPELAYCIQAYRDTSLEKNHTKDTINQNNSYSDINENIVSTFLMQSKYLVFLHELFHIYYKKNPDILLEDSKRLIRTAEKTTINSEYFDNFYQGKDLEGFMSDGLNELRKSDRLHEEASCDYRALMETISIYLKLNIGESEATVCQIHEAFRLTQMLTNNFSSIFSSWKVLYKNYSLADNYDVYFTLCNQLLEDIAQMSLLRNTIIPVFIETLSLGKHQISSFQSFIDTDVVRQANNEALEMTLNEKFIYNIFDASLDLRNCLDYNPFVLKDVVLRNASY